MRFSAAQIACANLRHYWRMHLAVAVGVLVGTAVITGALVVGSSVRGSLKGLTLQRLGKIQAAFVTSDLFRAALADELSEQIADSPQLQQYYSSAQAALLLPGTLETTGLKTTSAQTTSAKTTTAETAATVLTAKGLRRAAGITVVGHAPDFWSLEMTDAVRDLYSQNEEGILLTKPVAEELGVSVGEEVLLTVSQQKKISGESPLGEKQDTVRILRVPVEAILPVEGLARFSLTPTQHQTRTVFIPLARLQKLLEIAGQANTLLVTAEASTTRALANIVPTDAASTLLRETLSPRLSDLGLRLSFSSSDEANRAILLTSERLVLPRSVVKKVNQACEDFSLPKPQPVITYLANRITVGKRTVSYSMLTGVDSRATLGPLLEASGEPIRIAKNEIVINRWLADRLAAAVGDMVSFRYFLPESTHGTPVTRRLKTSLKIKAIVPLKTAAGKRTLAADPTLTPQLKGVTDQDSINDWDLPFQLTEKITAADEEYWETYSTTPKAFISPALASEIFSSRWGTTSLLRWPAETTSVVQLRARLLSVIAPEDLGLRFLPVKQRGLLASAGTTPFDGLFLGFSLFLLASALLLITLLFRLQMQQRAREIGLWYALGFTPKEVLRSLSYEGLVVASVGSLGGVVCGVGYAGAMIYGLKTIWLQAIISPFLTLHTPFSSLLLGGGFGLLVAWLTIYNVVRKLLRKTPYELLTGQSQIIPSQIISGQIRPAATNAGLGKNVTEKNVTEKDAAGKGSRVDFGTKRKQLRTRLFYLGTGGGAVAGLVSGAALQGEAQAGAFFGAGVCLLCFLVRTWQEMMLLLASPVQTTGRFWHASWWVARFKKIVPHSFRLALNSTTRNLDRSTLTVSLVAAACFLILAISAFRMTPTSSGTGGFTYVAESSHPLLFDLSTAAGQEELGIEDATLKKLAEWHVLAIRRHLGEDASCQNLYQTTQPTLLGVPKIFLTSNRFQWAAKKTSPDPQAEPWSILEEPLGEAYLPDTNVTEPRVRYPVLPVVLDFDTAMYSLRLYGGVGSRFVIHDARNRPVILEVVGLIKKSLLQGKLIVSEANYLKIYPYDVGYSFFLFSQKNNLKQNSPPSDLPLELEESLSDYGFDVTEAERLLAGFLAVQNTYLSTFQILGALGLLLGTAGVAIVQLRNLIERSRELAAMQAFGYSRKQITRQVLLENFFLLGSGLKLGALAALVTLLPLQVINEIHFPWLTLGGLLLAIGLIGLLVSRWATAGVLRIPLATALYVD